MSVTESIQSKKINLPRIHLRNLRDVAAYSSSRDDGIDAVGDVTYRDKLGFEAQQINKLEEWSSTILTDSKRQNKPAYLRNQLHKSNHGQSRQSLMKARLRDGELVNIGVFLGQLDNELAKIKKMNYAAIYQNIEYCKGSYQNAFNTLYRNLDAHTQHLEGLWDAKTMQIARLRQIHIATIQQMTKSRQSLVNILAQNTTRCVTNIVIAPDKNTHKNDKQNKDNQCMKNQNDSRYRLMLDPTLIKKSSNSAQKQYKLVTTAALSQEDINKIGQARQILENQEAKLKPIRVMLNKVKKARLKILKFSLQLGYDIRQEGLVWLLKEINNHNRSCPQKSFPGLENQNIDSAQVPLNNSIVLNNDDIPVKYSEFPSFLTQQEINYIICKYKNDFRLHKIQEQKVTKAEQEKVVIQQAFENVRKDKNRKLSMIKEVQLMNKLNLQRKTERAAGHKHLIPDTLRIVEEHQKTKATKNELIYKQTIRKLNRLCVEEIYKGNNKKRKDSCNRSMVIMEEVKKMLSDSTRLKQEQQQIKTGEEKQLSDILKNLRSQRYTGRSSQVNCRNPISVIGCLLGWKRAKKILENQMNIPYVPSY